MGWKKGRGEQGLAEQGGPGEATADSIENAGVESSSSRRWDRPRDAFLPGACRAGERWRHRAGPLRGAAQHDEEWPHARAERALYAVGAGHSQDFRHSVDGPVVGRPVLGHSERSPTAAGDGELRALYLSDLRRPL